MINNASVILWCYVDDTVEYVDDGINNGNCGGTDTHNEYIVDNGKDFVPTTDGTLLNSDATTDSIQMCSEMPSDSVLRSDIHSSFVTVHKISRRISKKLVRQAAARNKSASTKNGLFSPQLGNAELLHVGSRKHQLKLRNDAMVPTAVSTKNTKCDVQANDKENESPVRPKYCKHNDDSMELTGVIGKNQKPVLASDDEDDSVEPTGVTSDEEDDSHLKPKYRKRMVDFMKSKGVTEIGRAHV